MQNNFIHHLIIYKIKKKKIILEINSFLKNFNHIFLFFIYLNVHDPIHNQLNLNYIKTAITYHFFSLLLHIH